ncbi:MAG TPA: GAF domain-containing protein, partial [Vicinamibacterales bacterium]|nr:GAF domain-containing protein [Vicinamibacterales bacterium]
FGCFDGGQIEELPFELHLASNPALAIAECWYWVRKLQARYLAGDYAAAMEASAKALRLLWTSPAFCEEAEYHFYTALSRAASCDSGTADERGQHLEALAAHHRQLEIWAEHCLENFENRAALVGAEIARIENRDLDAMRLYEKAIHSSRANGFANNEALAYECASAFYRTRGFDQFTDAYLRNARDCYAAWGADGKVRQLDRLYPSVKQDEPLPGPTATFTATIEGLDLATVIRVSQAVSSEIVLDTLLDTVMRTAMEHAGADRTLLFLLENDQLHVKAEAMIEGTRVAVRTVNESHASAAAPESLLQYVVRTHEQIIVDDASVRDSFASDQYFREMHGRSVAGLPLLKQGALVGVLYLENTLASHVFTPARLKLLEVLASQAAVALENTRLYRDLQEREARIRRLVDSNIIGIVIWHTDGRVIDTNDEFLRMIEFDRDDLLSGRVRWTDLTPPEWRNREVRALAELKEAGTVQTHEREFLRKDGTRVPVLVGGAIFEGSVDEGVAFVLDLTQRKQQEREISALNDRLITAQEQERTRIAGELHDGVMQDMLAITMMLGSAKRRIPDGSDATAKIEAVQERLVRAGADLRRLSHDLYTPLLDERGLPNAVQHYCEELSAACGIPIACDADEGASVISRGTALPLFRIVQEALGNAVKHARANQLSVRVTRTGDDVSLVVSDDGVGFDRRRLDSERGLGLDTMRDRATQLGGRFELESAPGAGTVVRVVIPT